MHQWKSATTCRLLIETLKLVQVDVRKQHIYFLDFLSKMGSSYLDQMKRYFQTHGRTKEYQAHNSKIHSVAWNCDGRRLASGSYDKTVVIFTLDKDRLVRSEKDVKVKFLNGWHHIFIRVYTTACCAFVRLFI